MSSLAHQGLFSLACEIYYVACKHEGQHEQVVQPEPILIGQALVE